MATALKKVSELTVDEFKDLMHKVIADDLETWKETFEIMGDKRIMKQLKQADEDWKSGKKNTYMAWDDVKRI